ncbi:SDR family NAD(P)-dependent oxidoreductase, partial [Pontimicrobium sp. MEBiC01747]
MSSNGISTTRVKETIQLYLQELSGIALGKPANSIDITAGFFDLGMDSKMTMQLVTALEEKVGHELYPTLLFEYQNIEDLSLYLLESDKEAFSKETTGELPKTVEQKVEPVAVTKVKTVTIELIQSYLQELSAIALEKPAATIDITAGFFDLGMDSKMTMQLVTTLEEKVGHELYPTLLFEYQNIEDLSTYLLENDKEAFSEIKPIASAEETLQSNIKQEKTPVERSVTPEALIEDDVWGDLIVTTENPEYKPEVKKEQNKTANNNAIAIIGLSGRYPQAKTIAEFWDNLKQGKDCVTEIPKDRWDADAHFDKEKGKQGKTYSKWGGFIEDADKFDPLFFGMSPIAAENMDPQARIFLEESWKTIEDAGYNPAKLSELFKVGVFAGVFWTDYQLFRLDKSESSPSSFVSTVANMTSFYLGLRGPSIGLDTQCSSSLTALHLACESIRRSECDVALAGGVNLSVHASKYNWLSNARFLSDKGKCEAFGEGGNGYVPAEGVGTVLLKRLSDAERDGDRIYGVIKGEAINHGGKSSGLTVPNLNAQAEVIKDAMQNAGVKPEDYSYVEAHGTGTSLGDPIEIAGLNKAFNNATGQYCAIGSVKSNIGHAESAAGIAGFTKVLLQLQHKQIVPSIHSKTLNSKINFEKTAFTVPQQLQDWNTSSNNKRLAGLSSFGAGGSNAHIIIEEYVNPVKHYSSHAPAIIVLSAKNTERLGVQVKNILEYIETNSTTNVYDIAYTLQVGRQAMEERFACLVNDISDLKTTLAQYISGNREGLLLSNVTNTKHTNSFILKGNAGKAYIETAIKEQEVEALVQLWSQGIEIDWNLLYNSNNKPNKISLPTYPFARERYWVAEASETTSTGKGISKLHPLVHTNDSTLAEQKYTTVLTGNESFLRDHKVEGEKILPGVAYLEWAREAGERSLATTITQLKNVTWLQPIKVNSNSEKIQINLFEEENGYGYEIYSPATFDKDEIIYGQGTLHTEEQTKLPNVNIDALKLTFNSSKTGEECYAIFNELGFNYGNSFQGIKQLYYNKTASLSKIALEEDYNYILQPGVLDSALQSILGISLAKENVVLNLPFSTKKVTIYNTVQQAKWCHVRQSDTYKIGDKVVIYDIDILSETGEVLLQFKDLTTLPVKKSIQPKTTSSKTAVNKDFGLQTYTTHWKPKAIDNEAKEIATEHIVLIAGGSVDLGEKLKESLEQEVIVINEPTEIEYYNKIQELIKPLLGAKQTIGLTLIYNTSEYIDYAFASGLLKTAQLESRKLITKTIGVEELSVNKVEELAETIRLEQSQLGEEIRYVGGNRQERLVTAIKDAKHSGVTVKDNGVYLITGGSGGLGKLFASYIAKNKTTKLILSGRSSTSKLSDAELKALNASYYNCDVTDKKSVDHLIQTIIKEYGALNGIIHSAGVIADSFLIKKTTAEATKVLQPKINGVKYLDYATRNLKLDFTVYFSSMAAVTGNFGQSDYASANTWLDYYAVYRNALEKQGKRSGHTLSINWPLWKEGGMTMDAESEKYVKQKWGMSALPTAEGILAFETLLKNKTGQGVIAYGERKKIHSKLVGEEEVTIKETIKTSPIIVSTETTNTSHLSKVIENEVFTLISSILKLDANRINKEKGFGDYGFDSVMMINLVQVLNEKYEGLDLAPTALINYTTISEFLEFLLEDHGDLFKTGNTVVSDTKETKNVEVKDHVVTPKPVQVSKRHQKNIKRTPEVKIKPSATMAIVAMNGRFSSIKTEEELWFNTATNIQLNLAKETTASHVAYSQIDLKNAEENWSVLNMDASEISQLSAQEKLIFEVLSNAMEHYKIDRKALASKTTGVFIAAQEYAEKEHQTLAYLIPNKVSYHLNLKGPSELVNTYCTSSYVAIHRAIQSITSGECKQAIVGGVNLVSKEEMEKAVASDFGGLFSKKGDTKSFSENAEGFVRSEGVGIIIIKPLEDAERDNDNILGVIKGSSVSHGGKGFSIEAPNSKGLKKAIEESILKANVPIDTIDYVEAHGIANRMADAIELSAIDTVYKKFSKDPDKKWHVGTSKPVVGHSELASGMASIIKVLKAFEHKTIPGIAGLETINSELDPNHSLVLTTEPCQWKNGAHPRRAGLNSYAVGGVNAHLILEEYPSKTATKNPIKEEKETVVEVVNEEDVVPLQEETVREAIEAISNDVFKIPTADFDETLSPIDYDFDSIKVIELVNRLNEHFGVNVKMGQILGADDFKSIFDVFETIIVKTKSAKAKNREHKKNNLPEYFPLSEGQKGLWFIQNKNPESTEYNVPIGFSVDKEIDATVIYKAAEYLLEKHPTLRVSFFTDEEEGVIKQEVKSASGYLKEDVKTISESVEAEFKILQSIPFDLAKNVTKLYIRKDATTHKTYILFMVHHIVFDGTSVAPFVSDFKTLLNALDSGLPISKIEEDKSYFDFVNQEKKYLQAEESKEDFTFWNNKMSGTIEAIELPYSNTKTESFESIEKEGISSIEISGDTLLKLKALAKTSKANLSIVMLAIFKVLLHRLTSTDDVIVKTPIAGRLNEKYAKSIGYYINMMLTRTSVFGEDSFAEVVTKVKAEFLSNIDYAKYPYAKLLTTLDATKGKGDTLFSIVYTYQNIFGDILNNKDNTNVKVIESLKQNAVEDYSLEVIDLKDSITVNLKYLRAKFTAETINAHINYYKNIIETVVSNPEYKVKNINILTEKEQLKLLTEFNATETTYSKQVTIVDLFESQAKQTPNATAIRYLNEAISYKTLDARSKQLALYLTQKGIKADTLVGLCMERSVEMVVAMLGVLRAGGAYVPIAPDYPQDRIKYMVEDSIIKGNAKNNIQLILAQTTLEQSIKTLINKTGVELDCISSIWENNKSIITAKGRLKTKPLLNDLAYVIYTSGSTGKPKGVLIEHSSFADLIQYQKQYFEVNETDQFIQFSNFSFDASGEQIYLPLVSGSTLN